MSLTALNLSPEALKQYHPREAIRRRRAETRVEVSRRRRRALAAAHKAAELLKSEFGASEVILFGSLARRGSFTLFSDVDLAAGGIPPLRFYEAVGVVIGLSAEFKIDLADLDDCSTTMRATIAAEGKPL
jgi:predicted nucleotidyltransferase